METLTKSISKLLLDPKYSDLEIRCDGKAFSVHRAVVCAHSTVIARQCDGTFKEAQTRVIEHDTYDERSMGRMLQFMYGGDYAIGEVVPSKPTLETTPEQDRHVPDVTHPHPKDDAAGQVKSEEALPNEDALIAHIYVYAIADYYEVQELKDLALKKFKVEKDERKTYSAEEILGIAKTLYEHTSSEAKALRKELLVLSCQHPSASVDSEAFMRVLAGQQELQQYCADLMSQLVERHRLDIGAMSAKCDADAAAAKQTLLQARDGHNAAITLANSMHQGEKQRLESLYRNESRSSANYKSRSETAEKHVAQLLAVAGLEKCDHCSSGTRFEAQLVGRDFSAKCKSCKWLTALKI